MKSRRPSGDWKESMDSTTSSPLSTIAPHRLSEYRDQSPLPVAHRSRLKETLGLYKETSASSRSSHSSRSSRERSREEVLRPPDRAQDRSRSSERRTSDTDSSSGSDLDFSMRPGTPRTAGRKDLRYYIELFGSMQSHITSRHDTVDSGYEDQRGFVSKLRKMVRRKSRSERTEDWMPASTVFFVYEHVKEVSNLMYCEFYSFASRCSNSYFNRY